ncbi:MAG: C1 family peptidase [Rikenellaceae bacterium]
MLRFIFAAALIVSTLQPIVAQIPTQVKSNAGHNFKFQDKITVEVLDVEDQAQSGTCWSFGVTSLLESDIIAKGGEAVNLSDMWIVRHSYYDKVVKYVRLHGHLNLSIGGAMHDVTAAIKRYGVVPEAAYPGLNYGTKRHDFRELDVVLRSYADAIIEGGQPSAVWERGLNMILDNYFGQRIASFEWEGKTYTPKSYAESLGLMMDDYISLTSFMHHPYNQMVQLELPDNWMWGEAYNLPIDDLMELMESVVKGGRSFGLAVDITEDSFLTYGGVATIPLTDEHKARRWDYIQKRRQTEFNNFTTTDDHCLHIIGLATDQNGDGYFKAKNSWGKIEPYEGYFYFSKPYLELKTILIMVDRTLLPNNIKKQLGIH